MYLLDAMPYSSALCMLMVAVLITQSKYFTAAKCTLEKKTCKCKAVDIGKENEGKLLDCKGATSLTLNDTDASDENLPSGLNLTDIVNFTLSNNAFQTIPANYLPSELQALNLSGNGIMDITPLSRFKKLKVLDLSYNNISNVDKDAFDGLCALEELYLKGNKLHNFKDVYNAVKKVPSLRCMDLDGNRLEHVFIPALLWKLQIFNLRNNIISAVSVDRCTYKLPKLQEVDLRDNRLTSFPLSILDSFNKSVFKLQNNPFQCDCSVQYMLENYECNGTEVNFSCEGIGNETRNTTYTESLILSSNSELWQREKDSDSYCSKSQKATLTHEVTEICWDVPEHIGLCEEIRDLISVTNGSLNLTPARHYNISGLYTYKEYHNCRNTYWYTVTGQVSQQSNTSDVPQCVLREPCKFTGRSSEVAAWQVAWFVFGGFICILAGAAVVKCRIKRLEIRLAKKKLDRRISTQGPPPNTYANEIDADDARPQIGRVSLVVRNGYLTRGVNHGSSLNIDTQSSDMPQNAGEAVEEGYKPLDLDENGYLIISSLGNDLSVNGYFTYIPNKSSNEVFLDSDGYLCLNPPVIPGTEDGYTCLIFRKNQGALGHLTIDKNKYIQLKEDVDDDYIYTLVNTKRHDANLYSKLKTTWPLLKFWENQEEKHCTAIQP
ncbi:uncharacterized protein LOC117112653 [Anneissia japonica]|uniref:uncharacterized protein LOC117112653 n=1 Tax=Anneissia japonica TaxID=1529436 RepID=UPI0014256AA7|nr:uncharacterized protein LOC117112653 [Anneissia japonica]